MTSTDDPAPPDESHGEPVPGRSDDREPQAEWLDLTTSARPVRALIGIVTVVAVIAVVVAHGDNPLLAVLLAGVVVAYGVLSLIDAAEQRLPNRITLPLAAASAVAVVIGGIARSDVGAGLGAVGVGLAFAVVLFVLRFGMGDVKMSLTVGTIAAWLGRDAIVVTMFAGALSGAAVAIVLIAVHRRRDISFSYGPFLAVGSVVGMVTAGLAA